MTEMRMGDVYYRVVRDVLYEEGAIMKNIFCREKNQNKTKAKPCSLNGPSGNQVGVFKKKEP